MKVLINIPDELYNGIKNPVIDDMYFGAVAVNAICGGKIISDESDIAPVIHAKWIDGACSNCGEKSFSVHKNYCSFCGARMDNERTALKYKVADAPTVPAIPIQRDGI